MKKKILLAEDEREMAGLLVEVLEELGHQVVIAGNGEEALEAMDHEYFDLLLTDIMMPKMDGLELIQAIRDRPSGKEMEVVVVTAFGKFELAVKAMKHGVHHFLLKPFDEFELKKIVEHCLETSAKKAAHKHLEEEKDKDLQEATQTQKAILMTEEKAADIAGATGLNLVAFHQSYLHTTGDFFYVRRIDEHNVGIFLADICGHGTAAAMIGMRTLSLIDTPVQTNILSPKDFLNQIHNDILPMMPKRRFIVCTYAVYNNREKTITIANGGNPPPINGITGEEISVYGSPIGQRSNVSFGEITIPFPDGAKLVMLSDGLVEAQNFSGGIYGEERLYELLKSSKNLPLVDLKQDIGADLEIFCEGKKVEDDVTFLILEAKGK